MTPEARARAVVSSLYELIFQFTGTSASGGRKPEWPGVVKVAEVVAEAIRAAVEEEREACAQIASVSRLSVELPGDRLFTEAIAAAIRERGRGE